MALKGKQQRFVEEYLIDLNATQACIRSGYSARTANRTATKLLSKAVIQDAIRVEQEKRSSRVQVDADYVLRRLVEIDQMDCLDILSDAGAIKPVSEWPKIWRQFIAGFDCAELFEGSGDDRVMVGVLKKIKWPDKMKNLELIGRHINVQAFSDKAKVEHSGANGGPIEIIRTIIRPEESVENKNTDS